MEPMWQCSDCGGWVKSHSSSTCTCNPTKTYHSATPEQQAKLDIEKAAREEEMGKPLGKKFRKGGRNAAFFPQLSGLARGLDRAIEKNSPKAEPTTGGHMERMDEAEAKRLRRMERNRKLLEKK